MVVCMCVNSGDMLDMTHIRNRWCPDNAVVVGRTDTKKTDVYFLIVCAESSRAYMPEVAAEDT